jgi:hypothetical protein
VQGLILVFREKRVPIEFSYGDVEATLARLNRIAPDKRVAFRARLKHLQRQGFPPGVNTGTGKRATYSFSMLLMLAFATELTQAGMAPKRTVKTLTTSWSSVDASLLIAIAPPTFLAEFTRPIEDNNLIWILSPEALRELSEDGEGEYDYHESILVKSVQDLPEFLSDRDDSESPIVGELYRNLIIRIRPLMYRIMMHVTEVRPDLSGTAMWNDLMEVLSERGRELRKLIEELGPELAQIRQGLKVRENGDDPQA